jgi:phosphotransferase system HPr (HPr) family protein
VSRAGIELVVTHEHGLHLRPAATLVRRAAQFRAVISIANLSRDAGRTANARSLLQVTALGVDRGHRILIEATGDDAEPAVAALRALIESDFP